MALVTVAWRTDAIGFYERQGWQGYGERFVKPLHDDASPVRGPLRYDN